MCEGAIAMRSLCSAAWPLKENWWSQEHPVQMNETVYFIAICVSLVILVIVLVMRYFSNQALEKHYIMVDLKLRKLSPASPTRKRLTVAKQLFEKGWKVCTRLCVCLGVCA